MNEKDFKELYKLCIDNGYKRVPPVLKECLKKAIDEANTVEELLMAVVVAIGVQFAFWQVVYYNKTQIVSS